MTLTVLRPFPYSTNGLNQFPAMPGVEPDPPIPADLLPGLVKEGYVALEGKAISGAPENKDMGAAPANKTADLRAEYERVVGKKPFMRWDADTLAAKIAEAKAL